MSRSRLYPPSVDPGFPVLSSLPDGWRRTTFQEIVEVVERPVKLDPERVYKLVTAKRSRGGIVLRSETPGREVLTKTQFETKEGDFLISRRQIIHGACGVVPTELDGAVVSNEYATLRTRAGLSMDFWRHYSHTPYFQRSCFHSSHGVDVEKMIFRIDEWLAREVDVPPLPEQRKIAAILSSVDDAITGMRLVIDQLQVVKNAMTAELLTRGLPGRHTRFKQTELGEVPEGWAVGRLRDYATLTSGGTPSRDRPEFWNGGIPWVKTGEIDYGLITETEETISHLGLENSSTKMLPAGALLMAMYGQGATRGRVAILGVPATVNQACLAILPAGRVLARFLFHVFSEGYERLRELGHEGTQKNLNARLIGDVLLAIPPIDEQESIVAVINEVDERIRCESETRAQLNIVKSALMSALLTGEVRVAPDEANR